jgi:uncharacterized membrane protein YbhN (UPF0104 family)
MAKMIPLIVHDQRAHARTKRRWVASGLSFALTAATLYFVFHGIDEQALHHLIARQNRSLVVAGAGFILLQICLAGERWRAILSASMHERPPPVLSVQAVFYSSIFFNSLGAIAGDVVRVWLARKFALSVKQLVLSVLSDRILTVLALLLLIVLALPTISQPVARAAWFGAAAGLVLGVSGILLLATIERMVERWRHQRFLHLILRVVQGLRPLRQVAGLLALFWALLAGVSLAAAAYLIARSLGIEVAPVAMIAVISMVTLATALPISIGGWGVREASFVSLLGILGVDREAALLLSVEFGLLSMLVSLPGGLIWLTLRKYRHRSDPVNAE